MNKLTGTITHILQSGAILLVDVDVDGQGFSALLIESATMPEWLREGKSVEIVFKETEVSLGKNLSGLISTRNRMKCKVMQIVRGQILSKIKLGFLKYTISSALTTRAVDSLQIVIGDEIEALVKANQIALKKP